MQKVLSRSPMGARRSLLLGAFAFTLSGCGGGGSALEEGLPPAAVCSGANSSATRQAIFVAANGTDAGGCGTTTSHACKTLQQGIDNCSGAGCAVFVRHGLYPTVSTIELRDGVGVYGGCRFDGEPDRRYRTVVDAKPAAGTPAVSAKGVNSPTTFDSVVVMGKDETARGTASIAMAVSNSKGLALTGSVLVAGRGGDGGLGAVPAPAADGQSGGTGSSGGFVPGGGGSGAPSCDAGGAGAGGVGSAWRQNVVTSCGLVACDCNASGGSIGGDGRSSASVPGGGGGGPGTQGSHCWEPPVVRQGLGGQGGGGGPGSAGVCSAQGGIDSADAWGTFTATDWRAASGGTGGIGAVGSGGGGGGPGGMCSVQIQGFSWGPAWGMPGGGGGAGGCAGAGGEGGEQGGASIAMLLAASSLALEADSTAIVGGQGGRGGLGATGGIGGPGGKGGTGGISGVLNCTLDIVARLGWGGDGGPGGVGGQGGAGGGGAGGNGGPSVGIALVGGSPAPPAGGVYPGFAGIGSAGGTGGRGGAGDCSGATGQHGVPGGIAAVFDAAHPPRDLMTPGQVLHANEALTSPDGRYRLSMQDDNNLVLYAVVNGVPSAVWDSVTDASGARPGFATMQTDGNFVVYPAVGTALFQSTTDGHPGASLRVQEDGHVQVIGVDGIVLWYAPCKTPRDAIACSPSRWN